MARLAGGAGAGGGEILIPARQVTVLQFMAGLLKTVAAASPAYRGTGERGDDGDGF